MERSPACQPWPRTGVEWDVAPGLPPWEWYLGHLTSFRRVWRAGDSREDCVPGDGSAAQGGCWEG